MNPHKNSIWPGLILILIGALLLVHKLIPHSFSWSEVYPLILIVIGVLIFVSVISKRNNGSVFFGTFLFLLGVFFLLRNYDIISYYYLREVWPIILIVLGLSFLSVFITKPGNSTVLILAFVFLFLGALFLLRRFHIIYWDVWDNIADYWPLILIIIGGAIIIGGLKRLPSRKQANE